MGCDANAHHYQGGSRDINKRGELVFDFITCYDLHICNRGSTPTFRTKERETVIDVTLANRGGGYVRDWRVVLDYSFSDHCLLVSILRKRGSSPIGTREGQIGSPLGGQSVGTLGILRAGEIQLRVSSWW